MFNIQKISQRYDQREDRIELAIQNEHGHVIRLWLTQRLACRMLQVLNKWLPEIREVEQSQTQSANTDKPQTELSGAPAMQNQEQASITEQSQSVIQNIAVDFNLAAEEGLLNTIDMSRNAQDYQLTFKWGVTGIATINMGLAQMDNYLRGMAQLFHNANWNMSAFPDNTTHALKEKQPSFEDFPEDGNQSAYTLH